ncbi:uncharacterized protein V6R79_012936 [Siganus canaliculatus]
MAEHRIRRNEKERRKNRGGTSHRKVTQYPGPSATKRSFLHAAPSPDPRLPDLEQGYSSRVKPPSLDLILCRLAHGGPERPADFCPCTHGRGGLTIACMSQAPGWVLEPA